MCFELGKLLNVELNFFFDSARLLKNMFVFNEFVVVICLEVFKNSTIEVYFSIDFLF
jgi:hypothetical protein